ncbi:hypothetical protein IU449_01380 [Nocardia higoensis]|uniref:DUF222 domain-containing protein n=1 Tax=Nocardia higoensis TaxID=228599 RepID=A0ABS0D3Y6_9NOCA|nr:hypothetical protein [Nocardia higoensis]MBF6353213.1 hypothetical protein [Nocardia higoensis]
MLGVHLAELTSVQDAGVTDALEVVAGFDAALVGGFGRIGDEAADALAGLAAAVSGSPLSSAVADAAAALAAGSVEPEKLAALAAARAALLGAVHDALLERFDKAVGRERAAHEQTPVPTAPGGVVAGCRAWLQELAINGWRGVDHDLVSAADRTIEALWAAPELRRLAVLLDGFAAELRAAAPIATLDQIPARRWADLWSQALLLTWRGQSDIEPETVSGRLLVIGVDVHEHGTAVQAQVHAVLETGTGAARSVRISIGAAKVDTIVGPAVWQVLGDHPRLLRALAERRAITVTDMSLTVDGDLLWVDANAELGDATDPFTTARIQLPKALAAAVAPLDRHPVHLGEPVLVENYRFDDGAMVIDDHRLPVELDRLPRCGPLTADLVATSTACLGLVRWEAGRWRLRPLAVEYLFKKATTSAHTGDWAQGPTDPKVAKALAKSGDAVEVLRERAGRLLRK